MGRNDIVVANNNEIQNLYEGNYSIREIAQKIIDDPNYVDDVENIISVSVSYNYYKTDYFRLLVVAQSKIIEGIPLGEYGELEHYYYDEPYVWNKKKKIF